MTDVSTTCAVVIGSEDDYRTGCRNVSPIQDYVHPDDQTQPTFEMTPGFKPFIDLIIANKSQSRHSHNSQNLELFRNIIAGIGAIFRASKSFPVRAQFL